MNFVHLGGVCSTWNIHQWRNDRSDCPKISQIDPMNREFPSLPKYPRSLILWGLWVHLYARHPIESIRESYRGIRKSAGVWFSGLNPDFDCIQKLIKTNKHTASFCRTWDILSHPCDKMSHLTSVLIRSCLHLPYTIKSFARVKRNTSS